VPLLVAPETISLGSGGTPQDSLVLVQTAGGETIANQRAMQRALAEDFPNIDVLTRVAVSAPTSSSRSTSSSPC